MDLWGFSGISSMQKVGATSGPTKKWGARFETYLRKSKINHNFLVQLANDLLL